MKKQKWLPHAVIDGLLNTVVYIALQWFGTTVFFDYLNVNFELYLLFTLFCVVIISMVYLMYMSKCKKVRELFGFTLVSALIFNLCMLLLFACMITQIITNVPFQRELGNGDGLIIMFVALYFAFFTIAIRLLILICETVRLRRVKNED